MGKLKTLFIGAAAVGCVVLSGTATAAGDFMRGAAYYTAGVSVSGSSPNSAESGGTSTTSSSTSSTTNTPNTSSSPDTTSAPNTSSTPNSPSTTSGTPTTLPVAQKRGRIITKNRTEGTDDTDYSEFTGRDSVIERYNFGYFDDPNIITLPGGAQIRNCTAEDNAKLLAAALELPELGAADGLSLADEPQVLIYHTHTSESFLPFGDRCDSDYPIRSSDCSRNMTAVGDAICEALARRGISSVHDCRVHDYPMFTGAYYRSAETLLENLEEYPSIKIAIDLHRDGILNDDASVTAPVAEINGKTAAQFMIITGCDSPETEIPDYIKNFKLACLIQSSAEELYPTLARPVLFDYRNYNQSLFAGDLLIEVGSQGNSLGEAVYTGDLLGDVLAKTITTLAFDN